MLFQVKKLTVELNKRIDEHDSAAAMGFEKPEITIQVGYIQLIIIVKYEAFL